MAPIPVTPQMLDAAYAYLEQLSSMVGMAPKDQVRSMLTEVYKIMYSRRPDRLIDNPAIEPAVSHIPKTNLP